MTRVRESICQSLRPFLPGVIVPRVPRAFIHSQLTWVHAFYIPCKPLPPFLPAMKLASSIAFLHLRLQSLTYFCKSIGYFCSSCCCYCASLLLKVPDCLVKRSFFFEMPISHLLRRAVSTGMVRSESSFCWSSVPFNTRACLIISRQIITRTLSSFIIPGSICSQNQQNANHSRQNHYRARPLSAFILILILILIASISTSSTE